MTTKTAVTKIADPIGLIRDLFKRKPKLSGNVQYQTWKEILLRDNEEIDSEGLLDAVLRPIFNKTLEPPVVRAPRRSREQIEADDKVAVAKAVAKHKAIVEREARIMALDMVASGARCELPAADSNYSSAD